MTGHDIWHVAVLGTTLLAAAGLAVLLLAPLVFDEPPPGVTHSRPAVLVVTGAAVVLVGLEWLGVH